MSGTRSGSVAALVVSHWALDALTHRPDLPLWPGGPKVGLGLWNSRPATALAEFALLLGGAWLYVRATGRARPGWALGVFVAFLAVIQAANYFGPPPPSVAAIAVVGLAQWLLPPWAAWVDRRQTAPGPAGSGPASGRASK